MKKYLKNLGKILYNGFYSIAEGMSTFNIFPDTNIKLPSEKEHWEGINKNIEEYRRITGKYLEDTMKKFSKENNLDSKL